MKEQRLIIFCSEIDTDPEKVRLSLVELADQLGLPELDVERVTGPEALAESGWMALAVGGPGGTPADLPALGRQLEPLVQGLSRGLREDILCVFADPGSAYARACLQSPGGFPRSSEGEVFHVLRQAASWLETDAAQLLRYFSAAAGRRKGLAVPVDLSEVQVSAEEKDLELEQDEDDRFVEAKLKLARELMEQYLSHRK